MEPENYFAVGFIALLAVGIAAYAVYAAVVFIYRIMHDKLTDGVTKKTGFVTEVTGFIALILVVITVLVLVCMGLGWLVAPWVGLG